MLVMEKEAFSLQDLLDTGLVVNVWVNLEEDGLVLPQYLYENPHMIMPEGCDIPIPCCMLQLGYNMANPIPDLVLNSDGVSCTLSFNRVPFTCFISWESIIAFSGDATDHLREKIRSKALVSIQGGSTEKCEEEASPASSAEKPKRERPDWLRVIK